MWGAHRSSAGGAAIDRSFRRREVAYLHAHHARRGCHSCRTDRVLRRRRQQAALPRSLPSDCTFVSTAECWFQGGRENDTTQDRKKPG